MSTGVDLSQFYDMFFDEAEELLADMEQLLLGLDVSAPAMDDLNGIFRAAHSIKGGAGTFGCFEHLANTTHILENVLDSIRQGDLTLRKDMIDVFLETKDVLSDQIAAYRSNGQPDDATYQRICEQLRQLAHAEAEPDPAAIAESASSPASKADNPPIVESDAEDLSASQVLKLVLTDISPDDAKALEAEMDIMGTVIDKKAEENKLTLWVDTTASAEDITAVCCFVVNEQQVEVEMADAPDDPKQSVSPPSAALVSALEQPPQAATGSADQDVSPATRASRGASTASSTTLRVGVERVDQIINLVGELVITQAMLTQTASSMDPVLHDRLINGVEQLERNARDLQEAVMSIRMMPMDYVFSRFPRVVRESASRMQKQIRLVTTGQATELDKSLIERIIDPLTHLVRNSIDHGIELPEDRRKSGKDPEGVLTLSAEHSGGHIVIQVADDGAGLDRDRILEKAISSGFPVDENTPDDELWQLIFAPGFSTAKEVTDISGRGVGMDVVRRNIQGMGGHVHLSSEKGKGTVTRIILPLTLAILDGMSVQAGEETFILPLSNVMESMQPTSDQIHQLTDGENVLYVRGEYLPLIALHDIFDVEGAEIDPTRAIAVILRAEELRFALIVDRLVGQHQVVVKNLETNYRKIPGVSAATILGDGSVALIVDVFSLMRLPQEKRTTQLAAV